MLFRSKKKRYRKMMAIPYFGRIDFQEKGQPEVLPLYTYLNLLYNIGNVYVGYKNRNNY